MGREIKPLDPLGVAEPEDEGVYSQRFRPEHVCYCPTCGQRAEGVTLLLGSRQRPGLLEDTMHEVVIRMDPCRHQVDGYEVHDRGAVIDTREVIEVKEVGPGATPPLAAGRDEGR